MASLKNFKKPPLLCFEKKPPEASSRGASSKAPFGFTVLNPRNPLEHPNHASSHNQWCIIFFCVVQIAWVYPLKPAQPRMKLDGDPKLIGGEADATHLP